jgi:spermidine/putrescine-binding protein
MYTDLRTDYLLVSQSAPAVLGISSDIYHAMEEYDTINFLLPKEGSFILIDMWLIPNVTQKEDWVYQFLSYVYRPEVVKEFADLYNFFPAMRDVPAGDNRYVLTPTQSLFSRVRLFDYDIPEQQMRELWISLKS